MPANSNRALHVTNRNHLKKTLYALESQLTRTGVNPPTGCGNLPTAGMLDLMATAPAFTSTNQAVPPAPAHAPAARNFRDAHFRTAQNQATEKASKAEGYLGAGRGRFG